MGMFTTVIHPETGEQLQFKTGHDNCETYRVGDAVDFRLMPEAGASHLADDVYPALACRDGGPALWYFVVIKGHKVHSVLPAPDGEDVDHHAEVAYLRLVHGIKPLPLDSWTDRAWAEKARRAEKEYRWREEERGQDARLTPEEKDRRRGFNAFTRRKMREPGLLHKAFGLPDGGPVATAVLPRTSPLPDLPRVRTLRAYEAGLPRERAVQQALIFPETPLVVVVDDPDPMPVFVTLQVELMRVAPGLKFAVLNDMPAEQYAVKVAEFLRTLEES